MISTTRVFYPLDTIYWGGGGGGAISPANICPWGLNILGKSVQGTSIHRIFLSGGGGGGGRGGGGGEGGGGEGGGGEGGDKN